MPPISGTMYGLLHQAVRNLHDRERKEQQHKSKRRIGLYKTEEWSIGISGDNALGADAAVKAQRFVKVACFWTVRAQVLSRISRFLFFAQPGGREQQQGKQSRGGRQEL